MPMLLFAFWGFYSIGQIYIVENQVYQAVMNTAEAFAEYVYLENNLLKENEANESESNEKGAKETVVFDLLGGGLAAGQIQNNLPEDRRIERYVAGGKNGLKVVRFFLDEEDFLCLAVEYRVQIPIPLLHQLSMPIRVQVRQKAYIGYRNGGNYSEEEEYVYLAEYSSVYHRSRSCTHLKLTIIPVNGMVLQTAYSDLSPCSYCGTKEAEQYYITETGDCYHTSLQCSGLKRTVRRVRLSEADGYGPCSRCGEVP